MTADDYRDLMTREARRLWGDERADALTGAIERLANTLATIEISPLEGEEPFLIDPFTLSEASGRGS